MKFSENTRDCKHYLFSCLPTSPRFWRLLRHFKSSPPLLRYFHQSPLRIPTTSQTVAQIDIDVLSDMAFALRRPFALSTAIKTIPKPSCAPLRASHNWPIKSANSFFTSKTTSPATTLAKSRHAFQSTFRRSYHQDSSPAINPVAGGNLKQRLLYGAGIVAATVIVTNM